MGKKCFVISPIGEEGGDIRRRSDQIFEYAIKPAVSSQGYSVDRADLISSPGIITSQIIDHLLEDDIIKQIKSIGKKIVGEILAENRRLKTQLAEFPLPGEVKLPKTLTFLYPFNKIMDALDASEAAKSEVFNRLAESATGNQIIKGNKSKSPAEDDSKKTS